MQTAGSLLEIVELRPDAIGHGWDDFVERHPGGTLFHLTAWRDLVRRHFRHRPRYLEVRRGERRVGVLPLFSTRSPLSGRALISVPYAVYGGPLASEPGAAAVLLERVRELVAREGLAFAELRCRDLPRGPGLDGHALDVLAGSQLYHTFVRELPDDPDDCLDLIPRKSRASTRQARDRHGLRLVEGGAGRLEDFHRLFVLNKQKLGSPAFSRAWFEDVLRLPGRRARLHLVLQQERVLAGAISFVHGDAWNPYYSGAAPDADRLCASNFLYWQLMVVATRERLRRFDFGRSRADTGAFRFKQNMGFEPAPLPYRYVLPSGGAVPRVDPGNEAYSLPRWVIRHLPFPLARALGPPLMSLVP